MGWLINSSREETYRLLKDYFNGRHMRVMVSDPPLYIKAEFGSWTAMVLNNAKGKVTARIVEKNGGNYVDLSLDFALEYFSALLLSIVGAISTYVFYDLLRIPSMWALFVILIEVVVIWGIVVSSVSLTRRKLIGELNIFIQSLSAKKQ